MRSDTTLWQSASSPVSRHDGRARPRVDPRVGAGTARPTEANVRGAAACGYEPPDHSPDSGRKPRKHRLFPSGFPPARHPQQPRATGPLCAGLENRFGSFGPTRVRIPPSPLAVKSGHFFPTAYLRIARRHWRFTVPLPRDFPTAAPLSIPGRARPGRDHCAGLKTSASRHHSIATTTRYPSLLEVSTCGRSPARRREGVVGGSLPHSCPQLLPARDVLARHAQRTSPQYRRTARHARVARRSLPRGIPTPVRTNWRAAQRTGSYRARDASGTSPHPALVADANVILSSLTGGRARLVIASVPRAARNTRIPASHERQCARGRGAQTDPAAWGCSQAALLGRMGGARRRAC